MHRSAHSWQQRLVRLGRVRAHIVLTSISVVASVLLTGVFFWLFDGTRASVPAFFVPAVLIPATVAPIVVGWVLNAAVALDAAHRETSERANQLAAVLGTAPVGIAHVGPDHRLRNGNALARTLLGADPHDRVSWSALFVRPDECAVLVEAIAHGNSLRDVRWGWNDRDGRTRLVRGHVAPLADGNGARDGSVVIFEDITELAALEAQVARTQHLDVAGRLAGGLAHDFNNLLAIILANTASLSGRTGPAHAELSAIEEAAKRGARLTRRLLSISRRDLHAPAIEPLGSLLTETAELVRPAVRVGLRIEVEQTAQGVSADIDRDALQQALINLVMNAQDAMGEHGTIRLTLRETRDDAGAPWLVLGVHDDGPGMPPTVLARATEPFYSTKPTHLGTGLGLSIVADTMRRHGGRLELASAPGRGTDATLWLPRAADPAATEPQLSAPTPIPREAPTMALLLVEDEPALREATERILRHLGHQVMGVASVADALRHVDGGASPDLIISDVMMPDATGIDLLHAIRARGAETPVLLVSGFAVADLEHELSANTNVAFLPKPWTIRELQLGLRAMMESRPGSARE
jgi:two-component system, cell cycle sensor histidine kinase and response regulator CckA